MAEMSLSIKDLRDYDNWVGLSPAFIKEQVIRVGGWKKVFPGTLPVWASRIRNYFNVEPESLFRADSRNAYKEAQSHLKKINGWTSPVRVRTWDPYIMYYEMRSEEKSVIIRWFQFSSGGTIYHFKGGIGFSTATSAAIQQYYHKQKGTPIFKLVAEDGTGGSMETIIKNKHKKRVLTGKEVKYVGELIEKNPVYAGSYNYGDNVFGGSGMHDRLDVEPHSTSKGFYINPPDRHAPLKSRIFPEFANTPTDIHKKREDRKRKRKKMIEMHNRHRSGWF